MKKIKLITSILALSPIATIAIPMTSCGDKAYKFDTSGSSADIKFSVEKINLIVIFTLLTHIMLQNRRNIKLMMILLI